MHALKVGRHGGGPPLQRLLDVDAVYLARILLLDCGLEVGLMLLIAAIVDSAQCEYVVGISLLPVELVFEVLHRILLGIRVGEP